MAQVDVKWPSEDEDFDATINQASQQTAVAEPGVTDSSEHLSDTQTPEAAAEPAVTDVPVPSDSEPTPEPAFTQPETSEQPAPEVSTEAETVAEPVPAASEVVSPDVSSEAEAPSSPIAAVTSGQKRKFNPHLVVEVILLIAVIALGLWGWGLYSDRKDLKAQVNKLNSNPLIVAQKQSQALIKQVGSLVQLPTGETPTIANVTDATAARKQSNFFKDAQNGDKVLMYVKAGQAVLYRPSTDKVILVAPLTLANDTTTATPAATTSKTTSTKSTSTTTH